LSPSSRDRNQKKTYSALATMAARPHGAMMFPIIADELPRQIFRLD
jgi:hypothetical protein